MNEEPDELIDGAELCEPLRGVQPGVAVRAANRDAVAAALSAAPGTPWWRCSVEVPVPVAIATAAALLLCVTLLARSAQDGVPPSADATASGTAPPPTAIVSAEAQLSYVIRARYLPGVGFVDRETLHFEESVR